MTRSIPSLDPDTPTWRAWLAAAEEVTTAHLQQFETAPLQPRPHTLQSRPKISEEPIARGIHGALAYVTEAAEAALSTTSPGYLAYVPGGGLMASALADLVANVLNRYTGLAAPAPALVALENDVLTWLAGEVGFGAAATGTFTSGGSLATLLGIVAARDTCGDEDLRRLVAYTSSESHGSVAAAFRLAGFPPSNLRMVSTDARFRMDTRALENAIRADRVNGFKPFLVIAAAGTTNTGAIDPLPLIGQLSKDEGLWFHVDGAYGGAFTLCEEGRRRLAGIERADSITLDPHKGLFLPYGTGCVLFRERSPASRITSAHGEDYLQDFRSQDGGQTTLSPADFGVELSRPFRGLRLWLPLMLHGARPFRELLAEKLALAERLHDGLVAMGARGVPVEAIMPPQLSVVPFRLVRQRGEASAEWNARNAAFLAAINARRRNFLSSTLLPGEDGPVLTLRVCILSHRTHESNVLRCLEDIEAAAALS